MNQKKIEAKELKAAVLSPSVRQGRQSHKVSLYLAEELKKQYKSVELLDLKTYNFPLFEERMAFLKMPSGEPSITSTDPLLRLAHFAKILKETDHLYIVSPVYNASFPAALKNIIDMFYAEWTHKKVGICTVSSGSTPGIATLRSLQALMSNLESYVTPGLYTITQVEKEFPEDGQKPVGEYSAKTIAKLINETLAF